MAFIELKAGKSTAVVSTNGAQIVSFKGFDGREVIWQADPNYWAQYTPVLFPVCGSVRDGHIKIDGVEYPMNKHGFSRKVEFAIAKQGEDFVELVLTPTEESRTMYPFEFVFHVTYTLMENGYTTTFLVENKSDKVMPFCVGGHPAYNVPMEEGSQFTDYQLVFPEVEDGKNSLAPGGYLIDGYEYLPGFHNAQVLPLKYELFDERDALIFTELKSRSVNLVHKESGKGIHFAFPKMEVLAVWTMPHKNAPYLCLEPWHGMPSTVDGTDNFEDKAFVTMLQPGMCHKTWFTATLI